MAKNNAQQHNRDQREPRVSVIAETDDRLKETIREGRELLRDFREALREAAEVKIDLQAVLAAAGTRAQAVIAPMTREIIESLDRLSVEVTGKLSATADAMSDRMVEGMFVVDPSGEKRQLNVHKLAEMLRRGE